MESNKFKKYPVNNVIKPNKLLGQHFLRDKNVLEKIIEAASLTKDDSVLEVGPGLGVLTRELAKHAGQVVAVEKDKALAEILAKQLINEKIGNVKIIADDILKINFSALFDSLDYKVVANIPYYLTSHLIRLLLENANPPSEIVLLIQKEVAKRICAKPPEMSLLAVSVQFYAQSKIIASVSRRSFQPAPKVDSAIIKITPHQNNSSQINSEIFFKIVHAGFSHPRKQLLGNLSGGLAIEKEKVSLALTKTGIKNSQRAETLTIDNWRELLINLDLKVF